MQISIKPPGTTIYIYIYIYIAFFFTNRYSRYSAIGGWTLKRNLPDWLHNGLLGVGGDLCATVLAKLIPFLPNKHLQKNLQLKGLWREYKGWIGHKVKVNMPVFTLRLIGRQADQHAYPELSSKVKGWAVKSLSVWLAFKTQEVARTSDDAEMKALAVLCWSFAEFQRIWDQALDWLTESEANEQYAAGMLYIRTYLHLAQIAHDKGEFYFKIRPKLHYTEHLFEEVLVTRENPVCHHTFQDEDFMGKVKRIARVTHRKTMCKRSLQRYLIKLGVRYSTAFKKKKAHVHALIDEYRRRTHGNN